MCMPYINSRCGPQPGNGPCGSHLQATYDSGGAVFHNADKLCSETTWTLTGSQSAQPGGVMVAPAAVPIGGVRPSGNPAGAVPSGAVLVDNSGSGANG